MRTSVKFIVHALKYKAHVMIEGVCRKSRRGFPDMTKQEEVKGDDNLRRVVGIVKAAELKVDGVEEKIVATSVCDSKPSHFLSASCDIVRLVKKTKKVWIQEDGALRELEFLRLSSTDACNNGIGDVDITDQKRVSHFPYRFMRKTKWQWSMWIWGLGLLLINCYT